MTIVLNTKQQIALDLINRFIHDTTHYVFYLFGGPGTGKTFITSSIIRDMIENRTVSSIYACAPTHQAVDVLKSNLDGIISENHENVILDFFTLHKLLNYRPIINFSNGEKVFKSTRASTQLSDMVSKLVVIDECSMITKKMANEILEYSKKNKVKILFLGDNMQLPPVKEKLSTIFSTVPENYIYYIMLDEVMRTDSPYIKNVCQTIRSWDRKSDIISSLIPIHLEKKTFRMYHYKDKIKSTSWFRFFKKKLNEGEYPIILTWTNQACDYYNQEIRKIMLGNKNIEGFQEGDCAIFNKFYYNGDDAKFKTSDLVVIKQISTVSKKLFDWKSILLKNTNSEKDKFFNNTVKKLDKLMPDIKIGDYTVSRVKETTTFNIKIIAPESLDAYNQYIYLVKKKIESFNSMVRSNIFSMQLWNIYHHQLIDPYANISYGYSITVHKAQGSTFKYVMVDATDICNNRDTGEVQKLLYTAAGRAAIYLGFIVN